ncbi:MAG: ATP-binding protein [Rectinemataceae bacterium]
MIPRHALSTLEDDLSSYPAVALLGPRQSGKTTLAMEVGGAHRALYLDLESEQDRGKLTAPELYLREQLDRLVILDEVHRAPELFLVLRGLIDRGRREGHAAGMYLLLGSASFDLLRQSGETLAGRIAYRELTPFWVMEIPQDQEELLWMRGGFPESFLSADEAHSLRWRRDFIRTYLERDVMQFGIRLPAETLRRLWVMLAYTQGGLLNLAQLARNMDLDVKTVNRYLDLLGNLFLLRRLSPWHGNVGKRLTKTPKVYLRDSGLMHALLGIEEKDILLSHPAVGSSWEGFVVENLLTSAHDRAEGFFYRTAGGAEIDLLLLWPDQRLWAIEIKRSLRPRPERGFYAACVDLQPARRFVVYPGTESFPLGEGIEAVSLRTLAAYILEH